MGTFKPNKKQQQLCKTPLTTAILIASKQLTTLEGHSNIEIKENAQTDKKMAGRERGGEECPGIMRQSFVFARPITFGFAYTNPTLIG